MKRFKILSVMLLFQFCSYAQNGDSLLLFKEFMQVCNGYKQIPLHLSLQYSRSSNVILTQEDTVTMQADFYLLQNSSYIRFGELEQLIGDSLVLTIMNKEKQMVLSEKDERLIAQMKAMTGPLLQDTSLQKMAVKYAISKRSLSDGKMTIEITERLKMLETTLPVVSMELIYNKGDKTPEKVVTVKRSLIPRSRMGNTLTAGIRTVTIPGKGEFVIKEDRITYYYKKISHNTDIKLPVAIADRVVYNEEGNVVPAKAFESYTLIKN